MQFYIGGVDYYKWVARGIAGNDAQLFVYAINNNGSFVDLVTDAWTLVRDPNELMRFLYDHRGTSGYQWYGEYTNHWNQAGVNLVVNQMLSDLENQ